MEAMSAFHDGREPVIERVHRFNATGASLGAIALEPPIPVGRYRPELVQLYASSGRLVVLLGPLSEDATDDRMGVVDPSTGRVAVPDPEPWQIKSASGKPARQSAG
jgi:hypothetical protein